MDSCNSNSNEYIDFDELHEVYIKETVGVNKKAIILK